jgi:hypothetical protein
MLQALTKHSFGDDGVWFSKQKKSSPPNNSISILVQLPTTKDTSHQKYSALAKQVADDKVTCSSEVSETLHIE